MDVTKVVIHSLDLEQQRVAYSEHQMNLNTYADTTTLIEKITKSFLNASTVFEAVLNETSPFRSILNTQYNFMEVTKDYAKKWYNHVLLGEDIKASSMIFAQVDHGETSLFVCLEMKSRPAYVGSLSSGMNVDHTLRHESVVISPTMGSVKTGFIIDLITGETLIKASTDDEEMVSDTVDCQIHANTKRTFNILDGLIRGLALTRHEDPNLNVMKAKQVISDNMVVLEEIRPLDLVHAVYTDLDQVETERINQTLEENYAIESLQLKDLKRGQAVLKHKISTEAGIEISIPISGVNLADLFEVEEMENGQTNIIIKNVGKVI